MPRRGSFLDDLGLESLDRLPPLESQGDTPLSMQDSGDMQASLIEAQAALPLDESPEASVPESPPVPAALDDVALAVDPPAADGRPQGEASAVPEAPEESAPLSPLQTAPE
jgi:hypothetical protein